MSTIPSQNPPSVASRPSSSLSRPTSSASQRTTSRLSQRPVSRLSRRPSTRQSARVTPLYKTLVNQVSGYTEENDEENFNTAMDLVRRRLDAVTKQAVAYDMSIVEIHLKGLSKKARVQSNDNLAQALSVSVERLQALREHRADLDAKIKLSKLPEHLQLLIVLSLPPSHSTLNYANCLVENHCNPQPLSVGLTWKEILEDEPFEGEHWKGVYGMAPGTVRSDWDSEVSSDSSLPWSPLSDKREDDNGLDPIDSENEVVSTQEKTWDPIDRYRTGRMEDQECVIQALKLREDIELIQRQQYWRNTWLIDAKIDRAFDIGSPSTLGPSFQRAANHHGGILSASLENERYINEHDAVREVLMALVGRENLFFEQKGVADSNTQPVIFSLSPNAPRLLHLTVRAQRSILSGFAQLSSTVAQLRHFVELITPSTVDVESKPWSSRSRTLEAFAESMRVQLRRLETWCADREKRMLHAHLQNGTSIAISLLELEKAIKDTFSDTFNTLRGVLVSLFPNFAYRCKEKISAYVDDSPSLFACHLLDTLFASLHSRNSYGDNVAAASIMNVFVQTAEPIWGMLGCWFHDGIFMQQGGCVSSDLASLPQEFFIEYHGVNPTDSDFWSDGYQLRASPFSDGSSGGVPSFLRPISEAILSAGKSIGLLRILGLDETLIEVQNEFSGGIWPKFDEFMLKNPSRPLTGVLLSMGPAMLSGVSSVDDLALFLCDRLMSFCSTVGKTLQSTLFTECKLLIHLSAVEDLFLMRKGDYMSDFCDALFARMDSRQAWTDFHFLNSIFRDVAHTMKPVWIYSSRVRLSYRNHRRIDPRHSIRSLEGINLEYEAPFPLNYMFDRRSLHAYNTIFLLLLQIRRAKAALDNISVQGSAINSTRSYDELKVFYATRSKLSWFVNTIWNFVCCNVLDTMVKRFHEDLQSTGSLDEVIRLHDNHLDKMKANCFLQDSASGIRHSLLAILDMAMVFTECFIAYAGDATFDSSRVSITRSRRYRSRRLRRQNRDVVSFTHARSLLDEDLNSSDSDVDEFIIPREQVNESMFSFIGSSTSHEGDDPFTRIAKIGNDLDGLVRYIRRKVEILALDSNIQCFGILAFSLQDWDL